MLWRKTINVVFCFFKIQMTVSHVFAIGTEHLNDFVTILTHTQKGGGTLKGFTFAIFIQRIPFSYKIHIWNTFSSSNQTLVDFYFYIFLFCLTVALDTEKQWYNLMFSYINLFSRCICCQKIMAFTVFLNSWIRTVF